MSTRRFHRSFALSAVALVIGGLFAASSSAGAAAVTTISTLRGSGDAVQPAVRLPPPPPDNFPMQPTPRCLILNNFSAPRSGGRSHEGVDMMSTLGQEVYAMEDGTLTFQAVVGDGRTGTALSGNLWKLTAATGGTYYIYAHLSAFAPGLGKGAIVHKGQLIGFVGDTGNPGPGNYHLHFELHPGGGAAVNPIPLLTLPPGCRVS